MNQGFIPINRKIFEHEFWQEKRAFSKFEAWLDILQSTRYEPVPKTEFIGGKAITWERGQLPASVRFLMERWRWGSITKVENFLNYLKKKDVIVIEKGQGIQVITICKYDSYNTLKDKQRTGKGQEQGQTKDKQRTEKGQEKDETNKGIKKEGKQTNKQTTSLHKSAIDAFCEFYFQRFSTKYIFAQAKDGSAVSQLLVKIKSKAVEAGQEATDENILNGFNLYLNSIKDKWVLDNLTLANINSKFNELFKAALHGTNTGSKSDHSAYFKRQQLREQAAST